jgi:DNA-directed RNA polymerase specialized sigma24 family protein
MTQPQTASALEEDVAVVRACVGDASQKDWSRFFEHFETRFRKWIRNTLRDSSEADREDTYQILANKLLSGKILPRINLNGSPEPYLRRTIQNLARKRHAEMVRNQTEPLEENIALDDRLRLLADQATPLPESELLRRLTSALSQSGLGEKRLRVFSSLLEYRTIKEVARQTGYSKSSVGRYFKDLEMVAYAALGVPYHSPKKK